jgi:hypothetical protein
MWSKIIGTIIGPLFGVIDKSILDKDEAAKIKAELQLALFTMQDNETKAATSVLLAELGGESWLQRNWRPILMLSIVAIVVNNYLLYPYLALFGLPAIVLELPSELFNLMTVGVGGYVLGRSGEKIMREYKS